MSGDSARSARDGRQRGSMESRHFSTYSSPPASQRPPSASRLTSRTSPSSPFPSSISSAQSTPAYSASFSPAMRPAATPSFPSDSADVLPHHNHFSPLFPPGCPYTPLGLLGTGAVAKVYHCLDRRSNPPTHVAVKVFAVSPGLQIRKQIIKRNPVLRQQVMHEKEILRRLSVPLSQAAPGPARASSAPSVSSSPFPLSASPVLASSAAAGPREAEACETRDNCQARGSREGEETGREGDALPSASSTSQDAEGVFSAARPGDPDGEGGGAGPPPEPLFCPFIPRLLHSFQDSQRLFLVMHLSGFSDLQEILRRVSPAPALPPSLAASLPTAASPSPIQLSAVAAKTWIAELVGALEWMRRHGVVHRDLKPRNLVISKEGHLAVVDFGSSLLLPADWNGGSSNASEDGASDRDAERRKLEIHGLRRRFAGSRCSSSDSLSFSIPSETPRDLSAASPASVTSARAWGPAPAASEPPAHASSLVLPPSPSLPLPHSASLRVAASPSQHLSAASSLSLSHTPSLLLSPSLSLRLPPSCASACPLPSSAASPSGTSASSASFSVSSSPLLASFSPATPCQTSSPAFVAASPSSTFCPASPEASGASAHAQRLALAGSSDAAADKHREDLRRPQGDYAAAEGAPGGPSQERVGATEKPAGGALECKSPEQPSGNPGAAAEASAALGASLALVPELAGTYLYAAPECFKQATAAGEPGCASAVQEAKARGGALAAERQALSAEGSAACSEATETPGLCGQAGGDSRQPTPEATSSSPDMPSASPVSVASPSSACPSSFPSSVQSPARPSPSGAGASSAGCASGGAASQSSVHFALDLWSLGCIAYEVLCGRPAFEAANAQETIARITSGQVDFPPSLPADARDFISRLLALEPSARLGFSNFDELKFHPFLAPFSDALWRLPSVPLTRIYERRRQKKRHLTGDFSGLGALAADAARTDRLPGVTAERYRADDPRRDEKGRRASAGEAPVMRREREPRAEEPRGEGAAGEGDAKSSHGEVKDLGAREHAPSHAPQDERKASDERGVSWQDQKREALETNARVQGVACEREGRRVVEPRATTPTLASSWVFGPKHGKRDTAVSSQLSQVFAESQYTPTRSQPSSVPVSPSAGGSGPHLASFVVSRQASFEGLSQRRGSPLELGFGPSNFDVFSPSQSRLSSPSVPLRAALGDAGSVAPAAVETRQPLGASFALLQSEIMPEVADGYDEPGDLESSLELTPSLGFDSSSLRRAAIASLASCSESSHRAVSALSPLRVPFCAFAAPTDELSLDQGARRDAEELRPPPRVWQAARRHVQRPPSPAGDAEGVASARRPAGQRPRETRHKRASSRGASPLGGGGGSPELPRATDRVRVAHGDRPEAASRRGRAQRRDRGKPRRRASRRHEGERSRDLRRCAEEDAASDDYGNASSGGRGGQQGRRDSSREETSSEGRLEASWRPARSGGRVGRRLEGEVEGGADSEGTYLRLETGSRSLSREPLEGYAPFVAAAESIYVSEGERPFATAPPAGGPLASFLHDDECAVLWGPLTRMQEVTTPCERLCWACMRRRGYQLYGNSHAALQPEPCLALLTDQARLLLLDPCKCSLKKSILLSGEGIAVAPEGGDVLFYQSPRYSLLFLDDLKQADLWAEMMRRTIFLRGRSRSAAPPARRFSLCRRRALSLLPPSRRVFSSLASLCASREKPRFSKTRRGDSGLTRAGRGGERPPEGPEALSDDAARVLPASRSASPTPTGSRGVGGGTRRSRGPRRLSERRLRDDSLSSRSRISDGDGTPKMSSDTHGKAACVLRRRRSSVEKSTTAGGDGEERDETDCDAFSQRLEDDAEPRSPRNGWEAEGGGRGGGELDSSGPGRHPVASRKLSGLSLPRALLGEAKKVGNAAAGAVRTLHRKWKNQGSFSLHL
ncbi:hypothetical protein BESB_077540 [Besnoitia besnoiti]|uniref:non-specific serine/threonine protein kinase n=1 Tax=Besnoitia besnoiti TaxID=94643 RepID=A0A2A9MD54_BESBE|nr:hypothetical protein BESB_077540 [Besnoitia besnoiti]PFH33537.1 hypothetical protein BESB_077540 [Besnoitia besnoiti]